MKYFFFCGLVLIAACTSCAQNSNDLLNEVKAKLESGTAVSAILTNKNYSSLHELTSFRALVKKHATATPIEMAPIDEPGKKIVVKGILKNKSGQPVPGVVIYCYQTDAKGWYAADRPHVGGNEGDRGHARLFGYVKTGTDGSFTLQTVKPAGYPQSDLPAHIHVEILDLPDYADLITEFLFDDDERLTGSIREQALRVGFLNAKPEAAPSPYAQLFSYTIILEK